MLCICEAWGDSYLYRLNNFLFRARYNNAERLVSPMKSRVVLCDIPFVITNNTILAANSILMVIQMFLKVSFIKGRYDFSVLRFDNFQKVVKSEFRFLTFLKSPFRGWGSLNNRVPFKLLLPIEQIPVSMQLPAHVGAQALRYVHHLRIEIAYPLHFVAVV